MSSSIAGRIVAVVRTTAVQAAPRSANVATSVVAGGGSGIRRSTILVMTPSVPSLPTNSFMSDSPAASLSSLPAQLDDAAVGEHDLQPEHVVGGDAVLDAAQAARVGGDVAADRREREA